MHGVNYEYNLGGKFRTAWGTSTSAPAFASIIALLNDRLLSVGKSPLGFLNPLLYSLGSDAFNDITTGSNPGCGTDGFQADVGWDPVWERPTSIGCSRPSVARWSLSPVSILRTLPVGHLHGRACTFLHSCYSYSLRTIITA
ncbi:hypothetical protein C8Q80DRAFT_221384 [Daedaleopsis nitida]|nr:hypothetical protein C8Q80DRAFT_221384 [Daedaleopsis nitida]